MEGASGLPWSATQGLGGIHSLLGPNREEYCGRIRLVLLFTAGWIFERIERLLHTRIGGPCAAEFYFAHGLTLVSPY